MDAAPKLSFIVLSYNYADLIGQTIRSILDQTVRDFEIVVVDDASRDSSRAVVAAFGDPRIRLLVNERNLGGAGSYNRAVAAARGEWLVNLDADDWIAPDKCAKQLAYLRDNEVAVLGTYTNYVDRQGRPHPNQAVLDPLVNRPFDLNAIENWVAMNRMVRSSSMVSRAAHLAVGLDDAAMVRAPDYELWTRFLRHGYRFAVLPEKLTFYRLHGSGVTHADPIGSLLEMSYAKLRNLMPLIESRAAWPLMLQILNWWIHQEAFARLRPIERYRLLGMLVLPPEWTDYAAFHSLVTAETGRDATVCAGQRVLVASPFGRASVGPLASANDAMLVAAGQRLLVISQYAAPDLDARRARLRRWLARTARATLGRERAARIRHMIRCWLCGEQSVF